jgi:hypothetical protein
VLGFFRNYRTTDLLSSCQYHFQLLLPYLKTVLSSYSHVQVHQVLVRRTRVHTPAINRREQREASKLIGLPGIRFVPVPNAFRSDLTSGEVILSVCGGKSHIADRLIEFSTTATRNITQNTEVYDVWSLLFVLTIQQ